MLIMKVYIRLTLALRQSSFAACAYVEDTTPAYLQILELLLRAAILFATVNIDALLTLVGA